MNYLHLWGFLCVRDAGRRGNKITGHISKHIMTSKLCLCYLRNFHKLGHAEIQQISANQTEEILFTGTIPRDT